MIRSVDWTVSKIINTEMINPLSPGGVYVPVTCIIIGLTHWGLDEMDKILQTAFIKVFSSMKMFEFQLKFH